MPECPYILSKVLVINTLVVEKRGVKFKRLAQKQNKLAAIQYKDHPSADNQSWPE